MIRKTILLCWLALGSLGVMATSSDSLDVLHYDIHVDTINTTTRIIEAHTTIQFVPQFNGLDEFTFDLLKLTVDSIQVNGTSETWAYNDTLLRIYASSAFNISDTVEATVWYHGTPRTDPSGFGGFYFSGNFVYNLGVGFDADPHNYGRVWFPCKDNFTDRALFDFYIHADSGKMAVCNGTLMSETLHPDGSATFHWRLHDEIPTYLAGMAVSEYIALRDTYITLAGDSVPVALYFRQVDSTRMSNLFATLSDGLRAFEERFGPYIWERVGYVGVPFLGGAMEHATSVAFPLNSQLATEDIMAHELSHSWFGNLATCEEAGEMWLNEGFASWCEAVYFEALGDSVDYKAYVQSNHANVLRRAHVSDGGYHAVSGVGHNNTYGWTVYSKGASMVHNLRYFMGDSAFFPAIQQYLLDFRLRHVNSDSLRIALENASGIALQDWFDGWIFQPGFPHYSVDSFTVAPNGGNFDVTVYVRNQIANGPNAVTDNKLDVTFASQDFQMETHTLNFSGTTYSQTFTLPFEPVTVFQDFWEKIMGASTDITQMIRTTGAVPFGNSHMNANVQTLPDSALMRVTHSFIAPDPFQNPMPGIQLSPYRYWTVEGILPAGFHATGEFRYDGRTASSSLLDHTWMTAAEDSMMIFYRPGPGAEWEKVANATLNMGSPNDRRGTISIDTLKTGQYALAQYQGFVAAESPQTPPTELFSLIPNPTDGPVYLEFSRPLRTLHILDMNGQNIAVREINPGESELNVNLGFLPAGSYLMKGVDLNGETSVQRFIIQK